MDLNRLESRLARGRVAFVYTMPNFQNPTGITTTHAHRESLLAFGPQMRTRNSGTSSRPAGLC